MPDRPAVREGRTDAAGRFELGPCYDGAWQVEVDEGPLKLLASRRGATRVVVPAAQVTIVNGADAACELRAVEER